MVGPAREISASEIHIPLRAALSCLVASPIAAEPLRSVTDIAPVHCLVAKLTQGTDAEVTLLLPLGALADSFAFRQSDDRVPGTSSCCGKWRKPERSPVS